MPPLPDFTPDKSNTTKYLLIAVAVLLVVGVSIGATLLFTRDSVGGGAPSTSAVPGDIASANDTGPVAIITEDPTCEPYIDIARGLAEAEAKGWGSQRKILGPVSDWTSEQSDQVRAVATVINNAADQVVDLAKKTPHRVIRELYQQFTAYGRAYVASIANYQPSDNFLADANVSFGSALVGVCTAITTKSANRSLAVEAATAPTQVSDPGNAAEPQRLLSSPNSACPEWISNEEGFISATKDWQSQDTNAAGSQWTPEQRAIQLAALPALATLANGMEAAGRRSGNATLEDIAVLGALYLRAYVSGGDSYTGADSWLSATGLRLSNAVTGACHAAGE